MALDSDTYTSPETAAVALLAAGAAVEAVGEQYWPAYLQAIAARLGNRGLRTKNQRNQASDNVMHKLQPALEAEYDAVVKKCAADKQSGRIPAALIRSGFRFEHPRLEPALAVCRRAGHQG